MELVRFCNANQLNVDVIFREALLATLFRQSVAQKLFVDKCLVYPVNDQSRRSSPTSPSVSQPGVGSEIDTIRNLWLKLGKLKFLIRSYFLSLCTVLTIFNYDSIKHVIDYMKIHTNLVRDDDATWWHIVWCHFFARLSRSVLLYYFFIHLKYIYTTHFTMSCHAVVLSRLSHFNFHVNDV